MGRREQNPNNGEATPGSPYEPPTLIILGTAEDLTKGVTSGTDNTVTGTMTS